MKTRQEIIEDMNEGFYKRGYVSDANERLTIELMLDIREQNTEIIRNLEYLCKKIIM